jgi:putative oxidoreductase
VSRELTRPALDSTGIARVDATREWLARFPLSILLLAGRIGIGATFFRAGLLKYNSFEFAVKLFQEEYRVPLLDPAVAARIAMVQELTIPILLFLGLAARIATIPLLGTIAVIQIFVYPNAYNDHLVWGSILVLVLTRGPGVFSLDYLTERIVCRRRAATRYSGIEDHTATRTTEPSRPHRRRC